MTKSASSQNGAQSEDYAPRLGKPETGVVITGGASGIGCAAAHALAAVGRPVALWDIDGERAKEQAEILADSYGIKATGLSIDLRDIAGLDEAALQSREAIGPLGGLVHSAGTSEQTGLDGLSPEAFDLGIALHVKALIFATKALRREFKANPGSAIVAISSINARFGAGSIPTYTAAKGAILSLVRSMAEELAHDGIRVNSVSPGVIDTPIIDVGREFIEDFFSGRAFLGRLGEAQEIGRAIRFLLSEEASYMTGSDLLVDGGLVPSQRP